MIRNTLKDKAKLIEENQYNTNIIPAAFESLKPESEGNHDN